MGNWDVGGSRAMTDDPSSVPLPPENASPPKTQPRPARRRWLLPIVCVLLIAAGQSISLLLDWADVLPAWRLKLAHVGLGATVFAVITLALWFFRLAGFSA